MRDSASPQPLQQPSHNSQQLPLETAGNNQPAKFSHYSIKINKLLTDRCVKPRMTHPFVDPQLKGYLFVLLKELTMKKYLIPALVAALFISPMALGADKFPAGKFENALKAALAKHPGEVLTVEAEISKGKPQYEFDIKGKDGKEWEVEVDAKTGKVIEEEQEVATADDPAFKGKAKITQEEAKKIALAKYKGEVVESELSIESDGSPSYEFDIKTADGKEIEVEVDAITGKLAEDPEEEIWQIGQE